LSDIPARRKRDLGSGLALLLDARFVSCLESSRRAHWRKKMAANPMG
jgi:hypothetical protein